MKILNVNIDRHEGIPEYLDGSDHRNAADLNIALHHENDEIASNEENDNELDTLRAEKEQLMKTVGNLQESLQCEREKFAFTHQQDTSFIKKMLKRLDAHIDIENYLRQRLEEERKKTSKLSISLIEPPMACSTPFTMSRESDQDQIKRQSDEIKVLKSQLEEEKVRAAGIERTFAREKNRFEKELGEQKAHGERMKGELEQMTRENKILQKEADAATEVLNSKSRDIEEMQAQMKQLQDAEVHRNARNEKDRSELTQSIATCGELKNKLINLERERNVLEERVSILQAGIDRSAQRETHLESLAARYQQNNVETNGILKKKIDNLNELRQLFDSFIHFYLRAVSFRKALIYQKRYLTIVLGSYETKARKVISLYASNGSVQIQRRFNKVPSFKSVILVVIAIERMKFIHRRWQTGKRVCAKNLTMLENK